MYIYIIIKILLNTQVHSQIYNQYNLLGYSILPTERFPTETPTHCHQSVPWGRYIRNLFDAEMTMGLERAGKWPFTDKFVDIGEFVDLDIFDFSGGGGSGEGDVIANNEGDDGIILPTNTELPSVICYTTRLISRKGD